MPDRALRAAPAVVPAVAMPADAMPAVAKTPRPPGGDGHAGRLPALAMPADAKTPRPHYHDLSPEALDAYLEALETERAEADPWLLPAVDRRHIAALGDAFHRPYHALDQADLPEETEEEQLTPTPLHTALCMGLQVGLDLRYAGRDDVLAVQGLGLYYDSIAGARPGRAAPDLAVVFGASPCERSSYVFWRERKVPAFVMEVLSPSTWRRDVGTKHGIYANLGICDYVVFDPDDHITPRLRGYTLRDGVYRPVPREELPGGMVGVRCRSLGLHVCHEEPWPHSGWRSYGEPGKLRWYDSARGQYLEVHGEMASRAARAQERADAAEAHVAELQAQLREARRAK